jgi:hypothetical protein
VYENSLVVSMVPKSLEENAATQQRNLQCLYVHIHSIFVP